MALQRLYRPPTQSQNLNMLFLSMPKAVTSLVLVERATKCLATCLICTFANSGSPVESLQSEKRTHILGTLKEPLLRASGIRNGLLGSESLACDDEERGLGVALFQDLRQVSAVDVAAKVGSEVALGVVLQGLGDHDRTKVAASDTNVDDVGDGLAGVALVGAVPDRIGKLFDVVEHALDLVGAFLLDRELAVGVAKGDVKNGAAFGRVDVLAREHLVPGALDIGLLGELEELGEDGHIDQVLGKVEEEGGIAGGGLVGPRKGGEALGVGVEEILEDQLRVFGVVELLELVPGRVVCVKRAP